MIMDNRIEKISGEWGLREPQPPRNICLQKL